MSIAKMSDKSQPFTAPAPKVTNNKYRRTLSVSATPSTSRARIASQTFGKVPMSAVSHNRVSKKITDTDTIQTQEKGAKVRGPQSAVSRTKGSKKRADDADTTIQTLEKNVKERVPQSVATRTKDSKKGFDADSTILSQEGLPEFNAIQCKIAYGKFLRAMLEDCLVDDKIEREETQVDFQMGLLAERFQKTIDQLDKTNRRVKDISFAAELKRLQVLKSQHCGDMVSTTDKSQALEYLKNLNTTEEAALNNLQTKNVDFGFQEESGFQKLTDAVNDAVEGLEQIKKHSQIDIEKFKEYQNSEVCINTVESNRLDLESLTKDFDEKFLDFSENLIKEVSEKIAESIMNQKDKEDNNSDDSSD